MDEPFANAGGYSHEQPASRLSVAPYRKQSMVVHDADPQKATGAAAGTGAGQGPGGVDERLGHFDRYARETTGPSLPPKESGTVTHWTESWLGEVLVLSSTDTVGAGGCFDAAKFL